MLAICIIIFPEDTLHLSFVLWKTYIFDLNMVFTNDQKNEAFLFLCQVYKLCNTRSKRITAVEILR